MIYPQDLPIGYGCKLWEHQEICQDEAAFHGSTSWETSGALQKWYNWGYPNSWMFINANGKVNFYMVSRQPPTRLGKLQWNQGCVVKSATHFRTPGADPPADSHSGELNLRPESPRIYGLYGQDWIQNDSAKSGKIHVEKKKTCHRSIQIHRT